MYLLGQRMDGMDRTDGRGEKFFAPAALRRQLHPLRHHLPLEPDQRPGFLIGYVPCVRRLWEGGSVLAFPLPLLHGERKGGGGKGVRRQVCAMALALNPVLVVSTASTYVLLSPF